MFFAVLTSDPELSHIPLDHDRRPKGFGFVRRAGFVLNVTSLRKL